MEDKKNITYIIVTWNNEKEIEKCLDSIRCYTNINYRVIIVDNNSSDNTINIIKQKFPWCKLIENHNNLGFAIANNLALNEVKTKYICYLNPDTILIEDIVDSSVKELENDRDVGVVACKLLNGDGSFQQSCYEFASGWNLYNEILHIGALCPQFLCKRYYVNYYIPKKNFYPPWVIGAEMIMRTEDALAVNGFSTDYYMYTEDMDLCKKIYLLLGKKVLFLNDCCLIHLGGASERQNISYDKQKKLFENDLHFITKFEGKNAAQKALKLIRKAYLLRYILIKMFYFKKNRRFFLEKTQKSKEILKEIGC